MPRIRDGCLTASTRPRILQLLRNFSREPPRHECPHAAPHLGARRAAAAAVGARVARRHRLRRHAPAHRVACAPARLGRQRGSPRRRAGRRPGAGAQRAAPPGLGEFRRHPAAPRHARRRAGRGRSTGDLRVARRARGPGRAPGRRTRGRRGAGVAHRPRRAHARRARIGRPQGADRARPRAALGDRRGRGQHAARCAARLAVRPRPEALERGARPRQRSGPIRGRARRPSWTRSSAATGRKHTPGCRSMCAASRRHSSRASTREIGASDGTERRRSDHRRRSDRHSHGVRAGQARLQDAQRRQAPVGRLRPDVQLVRHRARPLLVVRRRRDGLRGLLLLEGVGRVPGGAGRVGAGQVHDVRHGPAGERDGSPRQGAAPLRPPGRAVRGVGHRDARAEGAHLRRARVLAAFASVRRRFRRPAREEAPGRDLHARLRLRQRPGALVAQPSARRRGQGRAVRLPPQGHRDPPGKRPRDRGDARRRQRDRRQDRRQRRRPPLVRDQPHGRASRTA